MNAPQLNPNKTQRLLKKTITGEYNVQTLTE